MSTNMSTCDTMFIFTYTDTHMHALKKLLKTKLQVAVQSLAGSGRLLIRPCLVALVGATHYVVDTTQEEGVNVTSRNVFSRNSNIT